MLQAGVPSKTRLPLVLYKGLLRKAQLFDKYPILKAYSKNPLRRGTLYIPSVSFHSIVKESFRIKENESLFEVGRGFKLYREWNDVYLTVSKKITWYNQSIPESTKQKEPMVKHIESIIPGSVLISHPAAFERNEGSEIVLILQRNEYETMGLLIKGRDILREDNDSKTKPEKEGIFSQFPMKMSAETQSFSDQLQTALNDDVQERKYLIVDTSGDVNAPFTLHKIDIPLDNDDDGYEDGYEENEIHVMGADFDDDDDENRVDDGYGYDAYDYLLEDTEDDGSEAANDSVIKEGNNDENDNNEDEECEEENEDGERSLDQIADDGRGRDNSPTLIMKEIADGINSTSISKADMNSKTVYKGGARFATKFVVVYTKPNKSELEGEWLSDNLYFSVFPDQEAMKKSKIVTLPPQQYRIFQGYHLFQTETLEKQVADGAYFVCHTPLEILHFDNNLDNPPVLSTEEIWSKILMEMGGEFSHFAYSRKSPILMEKTKTE